MKRTSLWDIVLRVVSTMRVVHVREVGMMVDGVGGFEGFRVDCVRFW